MSGKKIPISRVVNASRVSSDSDPSLPLHAILVKLHPVSEEIERFGSWDSGNYTVITPGGVIVSWLVSLSSEDIMGFIVQGILAFLISITRSSLDLISSSYKIYSIQYSFISSSSASGSSGASNDTHFYISLPNIFVSISPSLNKPLSHRGIHQYVSGVSDQGLYILNSGYVN